MTIASLDLTDTRTETTAASVLLSLASPVMVLNSDQTIRFLNVAAEEFFATSQDELLGRHVSDIVGSDSPLTALVEQVQARGAVIVDHAAEVSGLDFGRREVQIQGAPIADDTSAVALLIDRGSVAERLGIHAHLRGSAKSIGAMSAMLACDRVPGTSGGWVMDGKGFQVWLSAARGLTRAQRREALAVLSGRSEGAASKAAIELGVDEARRCPHCASEGAVSRGMARGLRRYQCKGCGRTFNALTGTPLSGLHHKERWLSFGASLAKGETVKASAARCDVAVSTAFRWRHRFLAAARSDSEVLKGIVEADETYVLESRKGARGLERKARRRGGKAKKRGLSREQVPVLMAADRSRTTVSAVLPRVDAAALTAALDPVVAKDALLVSDGGASYPPCAAALGVSHEALNRTMGERVRGDLHVQTVNSRHSRLKDFLRPRRGIATRYLDNYLSWFHLVGLAPGANDRACLAAAVTR